MRVISQVCVCVFCFLFLLGKIDYIGQRDQLNRMTELLRTNPFIHPNSVNFWYDDFQNWLNRTRQGNAQYKAAAKSSRLFLSNFLPMIVVVRSVCVAAAAAVLL